MPSLTCRYYQIGSEITQTLGSKCAKSMQSISGFTILAICFKLQPAVKVKRWLHLLSYMHKIYSRARVIVAYAFFAFVGDSR
jgi:hypothetical protein